MPNWHAQCNLTKSAHAVRTELIKLADNTTHCCVVSVARLAALTNLTTRSVKRAIQELEAKRIVQVIRHKIPGRNNPYNAPNRYRLLFDAPADEQVLEGASTVISVDFSPKGGGDRGSDTMGEGSDTDVTRGGDAAVTHTILTSYTNPLSLQKTKKSSSETSPKGEDSVWLPSAEPHAEIPWDDDQPEPETLKPALVLTPPVTPMRRKKPKVDLGAEIEAFERAWEVYPRAVAKERARKAWLKARATGVDVETIIEGVKRYAAKCDRNEKDDEFIAYFATWLNEERWTDKEKARPRSLADLAKEILDRNQPMTPEEAMQLEVAHPGIREAVRAERSNRNKYSKNRGI
jgi:hypothetical protein